MTADHTHTVSEVIKHDHQELKDYYDQIMSATDHETQVSYQNQFVWELARHSIGEGASHECRHIIVLCLNSTVQPLTFVRRASCIPCHGKDHG